MTAEPNFISHMAIIMDGNRRWAEKNNTNVLQGHARGVTAAEKVANWAMQQQIPMLTLFVFSQENWTRSRQEVNGLMRLLNNFFKYKAKQIADKGVKFNVVGRRDRLPSSTLRLIDKFAGLPMQDNVELTVNLAIDYGGKWEILQACRTLLSDSGGVFSEAAFDNAMMLPAVDLLIRTAGEQRLSNFLLWQIAYAELFFTPVLWPDFSKTDFDAVLESYRARQRRFGGDAP